MIKEGLKQILKDGKDYLRYMGYKNSLPKNPNNSDLYIVEFPKSGITWFSTIIANSCFLEEGVNKVATHYSLEQYIGAVHQVNKTIYKNDRIFPYHRILKSHDAYNPYYRHVIYLLRNPFSVMNSYYHFAISNKFYSGNFENFVKSEKFGIKQWVNHVDSWLNPENTLKLHYLKYEELIDNPVAAIKNLYVNLGWKISDEKIKEAVELSGFVNMKLLNNHYKEFCPFRKYDFVREGKKETNISKEAEAYIYKYAHQILETFYPDLLKTTMDK